MMMMSNLFLNKDTEDYALRVVLTWDDASIDLDIFVEFRPNDRLQCSVGFYNPVCEGVRLSRYDQGKGESVTFSEIGSH